MNTSKAELEGVRHGSVTAVDAHGRKRTVDASELNEADLALAEFGYHAVRYISPTFKDENSFPFSESTKTYTTVKYLGL